MSFALSIYAPTITPRLRYVLEWVFTERLQVSYFLTDNLEVAKTLPNCISYGASLESALYIPNKKLLSEGGVQQKIIGTGMWHDMPIIFTDDPFLPIPFDVFSSIFFLLSRYEEYYNYIPDKHGRYPATDSILYKHNLLERPIVDEWVTKFAYVLQQHFNIKFTRPAFSYLPTYDIDIAYSYKHKGFVRNIGGMLKDVLRLDLASVYERISVLSGSGQDPFDSFKFISDLHKQYHYKPVYFVLAALQTGLFDKNISPDHSVMQLLIKGFAKEGGVGMHPSYETSNDEQRFDAERSVLEKTIAESINISRQHYIKMTLPDTYRKLIAKGFTDDFSMGYGAHLGFRAGTGTSFLWYDIGQEQATNLRLHPFCFMDATAHYEHKLSAALAFEKLDAMTALLRNYNSTLITVFHNFSLGNSKEWSNWNALYAEFLKKMAR